MSEELAILTSPAVPVPRCPISIRVATAADLLFLDALQKKHEKMVGWFPSRQMAEYVEAGAVIVAEESITHHRSPAPSNSQPAAHSPIGYCISRDRYMGHDEVGIVYQLNVEPGRQRHLVGASLIQAAVERAAYGCRLLSCWCAQDIAANYFWEALGFLPLAFRAGSRGRRRVHIFWQRRIRSGDAVTPYWYPYQTRSGAIRQDRLVFPIPEGVHWRETKPIVLPEDRGSSGEEQSQLPARTRRALSRTPFCRAGAAGQPDTRDPTLSRDPNMKAILVGGRIRYVPRSIPAQARIHPAPAAPQPAPPPKPPRKPAPKNDPRHVAMARELRDRYLEYINSGNPLPLPPPRYGITRIQQPKSRPLPLPLLAG